MRIFYDDKQFRYRMGDDLVHAVLAVLNESASKGGLIIRKKKKDEGGGDKEFKVELYKMLF